MWLAERGCAQSHIYCPLGYLYNNKAIRLKFEPTVCLWPLCGELLHQDCPPDHYVTGRFLCTVCTLTLGFLFLILSRQEHTVICFHMFSLYRVASAINMKRCLQLWGWFDISNSMSRLGRPSKPSFIFLEKHIVYAVRENYNHYMWKKPCAIKNSYNYSSEYVFPGKYFILPFISAIFTRISPWLEKNSDNNHKILILQLI